MSNCLQLKKSNCKNCYKCIRNCPVKSIRFSENQANIVTDECILCGKCFVSCPQHAKNIRNDVAKVKEFIASSRPVYASIAPSFVANYNGISMGSLRNALKKLGFAGAEETAIGAAVVKKQYEKIISERKNNVIISSCCHSVNLLIQKHRPEALPYLAKVMSPMQVSCKILKEQHPGCYTVFIGPCIAKKDEAETYPGITDCVLTFEELTEWLEGENIEFEESVDLDEKGRTRIFPTAGGIIRSMDLDPEFQYISIDGVENCLSAIDDICSGNLANCFIEMSACTGSCIGGPVMSRTHRNPVKDYVLVNKSSGRSDFSNGLGDINIARNFEYIGKSLTMPGSSAITAILHKMGKLSKEQELNCGSCGYNTCREKAVAVLMGKADLTMCLPYLKERAESFSDKIINNSPNGIMVLNEKLEIQQINNAGLKILNKTDMSSVMGKPVDIFLDPEDYWLALGDEKNTYRKRKYLAGCKKYVEETVIYDRTYHIIISIMEDITEEETSKIIRAKKIEQAVEITDKVVEKQMRLVQEIASLLGESTAETKIALTRLKETLVDE
ncbi:MAG TPA: [Fe-Fe] hydrogenase large subunit C-terminal domain-containing protein [Thermoclostridium sp.]